MPYRYSQFPGCDTRCYDLLYELQRYNRDGARWYHWPEGRADYKRFYGIFSIDGKVILKLPFKASFPGRVLAPVYCDPKGQSAAFAVGKAVVRQGEGPRGSYEYRSLGTVIYWSRTSGTTKMSVDEAIRKYPDKQLIWERYVPLKKGPRETGDGGVVIEE